MKIYLAASWTRRIETRRISESYEAEGFEITRKWWDFDGPKDTVINAIADMEGVMKADGFVCITGDNDSRGGKHTELGIALGHGIPCVIVGPQSQIFHYLPIVSIVDTHEEAMAFLKPFGLKANEY